MPKIFTQYLVKSIATYQGINEIVLGLIWLINAVLKLHDISDYVAQDYERMAKNTAYYYFVIVAAVLSLLKGPLLLYSIKRSNKSGVMVYFILTSLVLLTATIFVIKTGINMRAEMDLVVAVSKDSLFTKIWTRYFIFYAFVYPILILSFYCFCQFCVYLFYRNLSRNDCSRNVNVGTQL